MYECTAKTETLSVEQIPFEQVRNAYGIPEEIFKRHSQYEDIIFALTHLTCGHSMVTPVIDTSEYTSQVYKFSSARFSLKKNDQQQLRMMIFPITDQIPFKNEFDLDNKEIDLLYKGQILSKEIDLHHDGHLVDSLLQLIPDTNQTLACPKSSINIPGNLGQVQQSAQDINKLRDGGQITINRPDGQVFNVQLCLYSSNMITVGENFDRLMQQTSEQTLQAPKPQIPDVFSSETKNRENTPDTLAEERTTTGVKR